MIIIPVRVYGVQAKSDNLEALGIESDCEVFVLLGHEV